MWKIPHLMLQDGQPDKPFFFSWANRCQGFCNRFRALGLKFRA